MQGLSSIHQRGFQKVGLQPNDLNKENESRGKCEVQGSANTIRGREDHDDAQEAMVVVNSSPKVTIRVHKGAGAKETREDST